MASGDLESCLLVVLHWGEAGCSRSLLETLRESGHPPEGVLVVDNGTPEESGGVLRGLFPEFRHLRNEENLGFAGGMNRGLQLAREQGFEKALLLNNDLQPEPDMAARMIRVMDLDPRAGLVGAVLLRSPDEPVVDHAADRLDLWTLEMSRDPPPEADAPPVVADWVSGAALLVRLAMLEEVGYLDESFFAYFEEIELCYRARAAGWKTLLAPGACAYHRERFHTPRAVISTFLLWRNRWIFARKHLAWYQRFVLAMVTPFQVAREVRWRVECGRWEDIWCPVLGTWDGFLGRDGAYRLEMVQRRPGEPDPRSQA
jgi:GT2 family glycosyltransferase